MRRRLLVGVVGRRKIMKKTIIFIIVIFMATIFSITIIAQQERDGQYTQRDIREILIGKWRVELGRKHYTIVIHPDLRVNDEKGNRGNLEIINKDKVMVVYQGKTRGFLIRFESKHVMMVRNEVEEHWVHCVREEKTVSR